MYRWGEDGMFVAACVQFIDCVKAAEQLKGEGIDVGVINARFLPPARYRR